MNPLLASRVVWWLHLQEVAIPFSRGTLTGVEMKGWWGERGVSGRKVSQYKVKKKAELKAKAAIWEDILSGILMHVVAMEPPSHVQASLLLILSDVDHMVRGREVWVCVWVCLCVCVCVCVCVCECV